MKLGRNICHLSTVTYCKAKKKKEKKEERSRPEISHENYEHYAL